MLKKIRIWKENHFQFSIYPGNKTIFRFQFVSVFFVITPIIYLIGSLFINFSGNIFGDVAHAAIPISSSIPPVVGTLYKSNKVPSDLTDRVKLTGSIYSPNIGWIKFDHGTDGSEVTLSIRGDDKGSIYGCAFSPIVGFVCFEHPVDHKSMLYVETKKVDEYVTLSGANPDNVFDDIRGNGYNSIIGILWFSPETNNGRVYSTVKAMTAAKDGKIISSNFSPTGIAVYTGISTNPATPDSIGYVYFNVPGVGLGGGNEVTKSYRLMFDNVTPRKINVPLSYLEYTYKLKDTSRNPNTYRVRKYIEDIDKDPQTTNDQYINISDAEAFNVPSGQDGVPVDIYFVLDIPEDQVKDLDINLVMQQGKGTTCSNPAGCLRPAYCSKQNVKDEYQYINWPNDVDITKMTPEEIQGKIHAGVIQCFAQNITLKSSPGQDQLTTLQVEAKSRNNPQKKKVSTVYIKNHSPTLSFGYSTVDDVTGGTGVKIGALLKNTVVISNVAQTIRLKKYCYNEDSGLMEDCLVPGTLQPTSIKDCKDVTTQDTVCKDSLYGKTAIYDVLENDLVDVMEEKYPKMLSNLDPYEQGLFIDFSSNDAEFIKAGHFEFNSYKTPTFSSNSEVVQKDIITDPGISFPYYYVTLFPGKYTDLGKYSFNFSIDHSKSVQLEFKTRLIH